jgi:hypothetical protein
MPAVWLVIITVKDTMQSCRAAAYAAAAASVAAVAAAVPPLLLSRIASWCWNSSSFINLSGLLQPHSECASVFVTQSATEIVEVRQLFTFRSFE